MKRSINFRMGRGLIRERRMALSAGGFAATWYWLHEGTMFVYMRAMSQRTL